VVPRRIALLAASGLAALAAAPLRAEEPPAPAPPPAGGAGVRDFARDHSAARTHLKEGRWRAARSALLKLFETHREDPALLRALSDVEEDLKLASFRMEAAEPTAEELFGKGAVRFRPGSRRVEFEFDTVPSPPTWTVTEGDFGLLPVHFEEVTLRYRGAASFDTVLFVAYDADRRTGVTVLPGCRVEDRYRNSHIFLVGDGDPKQLATGGSTAGALDLEIVHKPGRVTLSAVGSGCTATSPMIKGGVVALKGAVRGRCSVEGVVQRSQIQALVGAHYDRRFREWVAKSWDRAAVIPDWALAGPAVSGAAPEAPLLPFDAPSPPPEEVLRALRLLARGRPGGFLAAMPAPENFRGATRHYLEALACVAKGRLDDADRLLGAVVERDPAFAMALVWRGIVRTRLRDLPSARADLDRARAAAGALPEISLALARLHVLEGDLAGACDLLAAAAARGDGPEVERLSAQLARARRGPAWARRFECRGPAGLVVTDHSAEMANQVSRILEQTLNLCTTLFPGTARPRAPLRVHVFSSYDGYVAYSREVGRGLEWTAGAYVHHVRELVLWIPEVGREDLWNTVRHETFHAFLDDVLDDAPLWLNEGWAQCFGAGKAIPGGMAFGAIPKEGLKAFLGNAGKPMPLRRFLELEREPFLDRAGENYAQAHALVHYLHGTTAPPYRTALRDYLQSLRSGMSPSLAYEKHWEPLLPELDDAFAEWARAQLLGRIGR